MGFHAFRTIHPCCHTGPGHRIAPSLRQAALRDTGGWKPVRVTVELRRQKLQLDSLVGIPEATGHTHDALALVGPLGLLDRGRLRPGLLASAVECVWNEGFGVLGVPSNRHLRAGRSYLQLSREPLEPCLLGHDRGLAAEFAALTAPLEGVIAEQE
jgi:hypothetical protein